MYLLVSLVVISKDSTLIELAKDAVVEEYPKDAVLYYQVGY